MERSVFWETKSQVQPFASTVASLVYMSELERDLELERRKVRELQDTSREREKEYQRLKVEDIQSLSNQAITTCHRLNSIK